MVAWRWRALFLALLLVGITVAGAAVLSDTTPLVGDLELLGGLPS